MRFDFFCFPAKYSQNLRGFRLLTLSAFCLLLFQGAAFSHTPKVYRSVLGDVTYNSVLEVVGERIKQGADPRQTGGLIREYLESFKSPYDLTPTARRRGRGLF